jgi:hypothetical protein
MKIHPISVQTKPFGPEKHVHPVQQHTVLGDECASRNFDHGNDAPTNEHSSGGSTSGFLQTILVTQSGIHLIRFVSLLQKGRGGSQFFVTR